MKWLGAILLYAAVVAVAAFSDLKPEPDRAWVLWIIRAILGGLFFTGLLLFGRGIKQEILNEVRRGSSDRGVPS
jgi:hypothetical protein